MSKPTDGFIPTPWQYLRDPEQGHHADYDAFEKWIDEKMEKPRYHDVLAYWDDADIYQRLALYSIITDAVDEHPILPAIRAAVEEITDTQELDRSDGPELFCNGLSLAEAILREHLGPWLEEKP